MFDQTSTIQSFLDAAAAKQPAPGGGSVTALAGALAGTMGEMVVNYSIGKKGLEPYTEELKSALAEFHRARQVLVGLMAEDQQAYAALNAAKKLPADSPERAATYPAALAASIGAPQAMAATAAAVLTVCDRIVNFVNPWLLSDLAVCAELSMATVRCAGYNVRVNLTDVKDEAEREKIEAVMSDIVGRSRLTVHHVNRRIWARHESQG